MKVQVEIGSRAFVVDLGAHPITVDGAPIEAHLTEIGAGPLRSLLIEGVSHRIAAGRASGDTWELQIGGGRHVAEVVDERTRAIRAMAGPGAALSGPEPVRAPMPGMIVRVEVKEGDAVVAGQGVVIVEAMKMENELTATADGVVSAVHAQPGDAVEKDQLLVELVAPAEAGSSDEGSSE